MPHRSHACPRCRRPVACDLGEPLCPWPNDDDEFCADCGAEETAADTDDPESPLYALVHVPKAAGSTLRAIARQQYRKRDQLLMLPKRYPLDAVTSISPAREARLRIVIEVPHVGLHHLLLRPVRYLTVLRHPVERVISFYFYKRARDGGFESVARQRDNTQTRILAGMVPYAGPSTRVTASALDDAKANLLEHVELLLAERFDESLILAKRRLGWNRIFYWPRNVTRRPAGSGISDHFRRRIEADNAYDLELYAFAQGLFERAVAAQDPSFAIECEAFRRLNAAGQKLMVDRDPLRLPLTTYASQVPRLLAAYANEQPEGPNGQSYREFRARLLEFCASWDARHVPAGPTRETMSCHGTGVLSAHDAG